MRRALRALRAIVALLVIGAVMTTGGGHASGQVVDEVLPPGCDVIKNARLLPITLRTLPPQAGFAVTVDGERLVTGPDGSVTFHRFSTCGLLSTRMKVVTTTMDGAGGTNVRFSRWYGGGGRIYTAVFDIDHPVDFEFADLDGNPVPRSEIERVVLKSSTGEVRDLEGSRAMLHGSRVVPLNGELQVKDILYGIETVVVGGNSVVNRAQHRFVPSETDTVSVPLLFYEAEIRARDALFGFALGSSVELRYPDGTTRDIELDGDGRATIPGLPRGDYVMVVDAPGLDIERPVSMSRDQDVDLKVFSYLDIAVIVFGVGGAASALLVVGIRRRRAPSLVPEMLALPPAPVTVDDDVVIDLRPAARQIHAPCHHVARADPYEEEVARLLEREPATLHRLMGAPHVFGELLRLPKLFSELLAHPDLLDEMLTSERQLLWDLIIDEARSMHVGRPTGRAGDDIPVGAGAGAGRSSATVRGDR